MCLQSWQDYKTDCKTFVQSTTLWREAEKVDFNLLKRGKKKKSKMYWSTMEPFLTVHFFSMKIRSNTLLLSVVKYFIGYWNYHLISSETFNPTNNSNFVLERLSSHNQFYFTACFGSTVIYTEHFFMWNQSLVAHYL